LFTDKIVSTYQKLDILINNAAQTIRRPPASYSHLMDKELVPISALPETIKSIVQSQNPSGNMEYAKSKSLLDYMQCTTEASHSSEDTCALQTSISLDIATPSQNPVCITAALEMIPCDPQQVDVRTSNSRIMEHDQVPVVELAEVLTINSIAPYILCSKLMPIMKKTGEEAFVINVSSVEGQINHIDSSKHPHTNMAKASLHMMTRTSARYFAKSNIWMNVVDTGGISVMIPDGAARILDPIFSRLKHDPALFGKFFKHYGVAKW